MRPIEPGKGPGFPLRPPRELFGHLGISDLDPDLLSQALVHPSFAHEQAARGDTWSDKSRLEFLGDAVLDLLVSQHLYSGYPDLDEGELTKARAGIVSQAALAECARAISLGDYVFLSRGDDMAGARQRDSILSETLEALVAAVFLGGGLERARDLCLESLGFKERASALLAEGLGDPKSLLQEMTQARGLGTPVYQIIHRTGPDHAPWFGAQVLVGHEPWGEGYGVSKRQAEAKAAIKALMRSGWTGHDSRGRDFSEERE